MHYVPPKTEKEALVERALDLLRELHGPRIADAPHTRELIHHMIAMGIADAVELVELVSVAGGKRYDPISARFH